MAQNRKLLGMTPQQLAILGGLVVLVCVVFTVAGCFFLQGAPSLLAPAPQNTLPPAFTATPFVIPTLTSTVTPTPMPYELLIPQDWVQFKTALVEIWLPKEFKKEKPDADASSLKTELMIMGYSSETSLYPMLVMVSYEPMMAGTLDDYVSNLPLNIAENAHVAVKGKVSVNSTEAIRLLIEGKVEGVDYNDLVYAFQDGGTIWVVQYFAPMNEYYTMEETFKNSVKTFRIVR
jgi:hypothetical protein